MFTGFSFCHELKQHKALTRKESDTIPHSWTSQPLEPLAKTSFYVLINYEVPGILLYNKNL
jgi:hypothetical protein